MTEAVFLDICGKIAEKFIVLAVCLALIAVLYVCVGGTVSKVWSEPIASLSVGDFTGFAFGIIAGVFLARRVLITLFDGWSLTGEKAEAK